jgi:hypothetical protein
MQFETNGQAQRSSLFVFGCELMMQERRRLQRTTVYKPAKIVSGGCEYWAVDCIVLDLTGGGAGISIEKRGSIANDVGLTFDGLRTVRKCRVAWQSRNRLGVEFLKLPVPDR